MKHLTNKDLFTNVQAGIRFSHKINERYCEEFYFKLLEEYDHHYYNKHFIWDNINSSLDIEGILIIVQYEE